LKEEEDTDWQLWSTRWENMKLLRVLRFPRLSEIHAASIFQGEDFDLMKSIIPEEE
jgi:hypothetical protein